MSVDGVSILFFVMVPESVLTYFAIVQDLLEHRDLKRHERKVADSE